jgi:zinc protease
MVALATVYDGGYATDPAGKEGTAHLAEHLWFRTRHDGVATSQALARLGASWNALTGPDTMTFTTVAPADALVPLLKLEGMRFDERLAGVDDAGIEVERQVVANEMRLGALPVQLLIEQQLAARLYPEGHPYRHAGAGSASTLAHVRRADLVAFTERAFRPENATIVAVGDFEVGRVWDTLMAAFPARLLVDPAHPDRRRPLSPPRPPRPS